MTTAVSSATATVMATGTVMAQPHSAFVHAIALLPETTPRWPRPARPWCGRRPLIESCPDTFNLGWHPCP